MPDINQEIAPGLVTKFRDMGDGTHAPVVATAGGGTGGGGGDASAANQLTGNATLGRIDTATGTPADAAWTAGNGTVVGILKAIAAKLLGTITVSIPGQRAQRAISTPVTIATASTRQAGTLLGPLIPVGIPLTSINQTITITGITISSSNGASTSRLQAAVYLFSAAAPAGLPGTTDGTVFAPTAAALAAATYLGPLGTPNQGINPASGTGYSLTISGLSQAAVAGSGGSLWVAVVLTGAYTTIANEQLTATVTALT
jgi:hypothetical protein